MPKSIALSWSLSTNPSLEAIVAEAKTCEEAGLHGVWFPDYEEPGNGWPELFVTLSAVARETKAVKFGSLVTDVVRRHPAVTGHAFASLDQIAPGRAIIGVGAGAGNSQYPFGISLDHPAAKMAEGIEVIRKLWAAKGGKIDFDGRFFSLRQAQAPLFPPSPIPIYVAAYGPVMLETTARLGDGWVPECHTPGTFEKTLRGIRERMLKLTRDPAALRACSAQMFYPWEPDEKAYRRLIHAAKYYLANYPDIQWAAGHGKTHPGLRTHQFREPMEGLLERLVEEVPESLAEKTLVYGSEAECRERIEKMRSAGCDEVILEPYWIEKERILDAIALAGKIGRSVN